MAALGFTIKHPELISQLLIVTGAANYGFLEMAKRRCRQIGDQEQIAICEQCLWPGNFNPESLREYFRQTAPLYSVITKEKKSVYDTSFCNHHILNAAFKNQYFHFCYNECLSSIQCPVYILFGRHDWITPLACGLEIQQAIGNNATLFIAEHSAHAIHKDEPALYNQLVHQFIS